MKSIKQIALGALLTISAFCAVLYTSCSKDACKDVTCANGGTCSGGNCTCASGYFGSRCDSSYRSTYVGTYKGSGADNTGGTYTNWTMIFVTAGTAANSMNVEIHDNTGASIVSLPITLSTITVSSTVPSVFTVSSTVANGATYTGTGTVSNSIATIVLTETDNTTSTATIYTFSSMARQ